jgi:hypothetical protein
MAVLHQLCPFDSYGYWYWLSQNQSYPHDLLCRICGFIVAVLTIFLLFWGPFRKDLLSLHAE